MSKWNCFGLTSVLLLWEMVLEHGICIPSKIDNKIKLHAHAKRKLCSLAFHSLSAHVRETRRTKEKKTPTNSEMLMTNVYLDFIAGSTLVLKYIEGFSVRRWKKCILVRYNRDQVNSMVKSSVFRKLYLVKMLELESYFYCMSSLLSMPGTKTISNRNRSYKI